jgi:hypothetical protein
LLNNAGIDASHIVTRVKSLVKEFAQQGYQLHNA